jgi:hypothetical protein
MGWDGPLGGGNWWVRRRETIGQRINNIAVCSVPSPSDFKGPCFGGGRTGRGPLVETYFFTLRNGAFQLLWAPFFFFWGFSFFSKYLFQGVMKKLEIRHTSKGRFGFVRSLIRFIGSLNLGMNGWMSGWMDGCLLPPYFSRAFILAPT